MLAVRQLIGGTEMNYMAEVAKMLGIELGEYFEIYRCDGIYFFVI